MTDLQKKYSQADENNRILSAYRPLPPETLKSLREYYRVGLTYTSNALEGNSLTESETKVVIPAILRHEYIYSLETALPAQRCSPTSLPTV